MDCKLMHLESNCSSNWFAENKMYWEYETCLLEGTT